MAGRDSERVGGQKMGTQKALRVDGQKFNVNSLAELNGEKSVKNTLAPPISRPWTGPKLLVLYNNLRTNVGGVLSLLR